MPTKISADNLQPSLVSVIVAGGGPKITSIAVTNSSYTVLDDTAVDTAGGFIVITGTGFNTGCQVIINDVVATSTTFVNSTTVRAQIGPRAAGTYNVYLTNTDGGTAIRISGITYSGVPSWVTGSTLTPGESDAFISYNLSATDATSYSLQAGSSLPPGVTLAANGFLSGTVTGINDTTVYSFTINAIDAEAQDSPRTFNVTISAGANIPYVTALLSGDATTNSFVTDASNNNFALSVVGDTRPNRLNPYTPGYYSNFFDGAGDNLLTPYNAALNLTGDFTIECWFWATAYGGMILNMGGGSNIAWASYELVNNTDGINFAGSSANSGYDIGSETGTTGRIGTILLNTWNHLAVTRSGNVYRGFVNGVQGYTQTLALTPYNTSTRGLSIGANYTNTWGSGTPTSTVSGYISNLRIVKGTPIYTANFTPPTSPLTAITNTSLLTCQSNRFIDVSTNNIALTRTGDVRVTSFDPFVLPSEFETYGSGYFDGTGDYLTAPNNSAFDFGSGNFTVECWVNMSSVSSIQTHVANYLNSSTGWGMQWRSDSSIWSFFNGDNTLISHSNTPAVGSWNHFAVSRSGTSLRMFLNGVTVATVTNSTNITGSTNPLYIGSLNAGGGVGIIQHTNGYISDLRIVKGTALYTDNFTPPTTPLTAVANTSLLTLQTNQPFNNSFFLDNSTNNSLITRIGNATQGTLSPYGENWSNLFDGNGDYLTLTSNAAFGYGTGDFTIEFWLYLNTIAADQTIVSNLTSVSSVNPHLYFGVSGTAIYYYTNNANRITSSAVNARQWYHIALCRASGSTRLFIDGTQSGSTYTDSNDYVSPAPLGIGTYLSSGSPVTTSTLNGYISNVRILKGTALYTTTFTPSITPLTAVANTSVLTCNENNMFDYSPNRFTITRAGDVSVQNFSPFSFASLTSPPYSTFFDGTGDYLTVVGNSNLTPGTGDFTIEGWFFSTTSSSWRALYVAGSSADNGLYLSNSNVLTWYESTVRASSSTITNNVWNHFAVTRQGTTLRVFLNGVKSSTDYTTSADYSRTSPTIGANANGGELFTGYLSNVRVLKGTALYTANFTPPTSPLTAVANTVLLACNSNTNVDSSNNRFAITVNGDTRPTTISPFTPTYALKQQYTPTVFGGSMYFDGGGDRLVIADNALLRIGTSDYTIEFWTYLRSIGSGNRSFYQKGTTNDANGLLLMKDNNNHFQVHNFGALITVTGAGGEMLGRWTHVAVVRSGSTCTVYLNGVSRGSATSTRDFNNTSAVQIGGSSDSQSGGETIEGYMTDFRFTTGRAVYTSNFFPPLTPITSTANTTLLINGTSAAVFDSSMKNDYETVGDVRLNTATKKYGNSSIQFDGTGDYLVTPANNVMQFGTSNFTIEMWWNPSTLASFQPLIYHTNDSGVNGAGEFAFLYNTTLGLRFFINGGATAIQQGSTTGWSTGTWYHVAAVRNGNTLTLYRDGVSIASGNVSGVTIGALVPTHIGGDPYNPASITGFIDDFRVTNGVARYTANFTPPGKLQLK